jgi:ubiquinone/menaquinone biosynthesis C-methylase UbiE
MVKVMQSTAESDLKSRVHDYWNRNACGSSTSDRSRFSREYFEEIEAHRYATEPEILSFADFGSARGEKVLEVGVGAGTDFLQWVRAGAEAHGVDLTPEAVEHVKARLEVYGLQAEDVRVADSESLPFEDDAFDLVYSWGVIHHTPDTYRALAEIIRVCRPGGACKIMVYNRHSVVACDLWLRKALRRLQPFRSLSWCLYHHMESEGTKAYTPREVRSMLDDFSVENVKIDTVPTYYDRLEGRHPTSRSMANAMARLLGGSEVGWFMLVEFTKR